MTDSNKAEDEKATPTFSDIDPETLNPEMKAMYDSMQKDYTQKSQLNAELRREFGDKESAYQDQLKTFGAMEQELKQWHGWYKGFAEDEETKPAIPGGQSTEPAEKAVDLPDYLDEPGNENLNKILQQMSTQHSEELTSLKTSLADLQAALTQRDDQTNKMFSYHAQLNDLATDNATIEDFVKQDVLDHALKTGQTDLTKAYKDLYQDKLMDIEVARKVTERMAETRTKGIKGPGQQIILKARDNAPKSFGEASQQIMDTRASEGKF